MNAIEIWHDIDVKLIAILRGIRPEETEAYVTALLSEGFRAIEIPLNSPDAYHSIRIAVQTAKVKTDAPCLIGAGTVLNVEEVQQVQLAGGNLIVSPNVNSNVIQAAKKSNMLSAPGVYTPSECLAALSYGCDILKIFPASNMGTKGIQALSAVLPSTTQLCAVGGVGDDDFKAYKKAGVVGFGLGSSLYKSGMHLDDFHAKAKTAVKDFKT